MVSLSVILSAVLWQPSASMAQLTDEERAELEQQLAELEEEIKETQSTLAETRQQTASYQRDRAILDGQIQEAQLSIRQKNLAISSLNDEISVREEAIVLYEDQIYRHKNQLAAALRQTNAAEDKTLVEMVLSNQGFSEFFQDFDRLQEVRLQLAAAIEEVEDFRDAVNAERERLGLKRVEEIDVRQAIERQKQTVEIAEQQKRQLIAANIDKEEDYQSLIQEKQAEAQKIRDALFALRDAGPVPFGTALEYANAASRSASSFINCSIPAAITLLTEANEPSSTLRAANS